jgi:hypothetical protein
MSAPAGHGAYGFRFEWPAELAGLRDALVPAPADWPTIRVLVERCEPGPERDNEVRFHERHAEAALPGGGHVHMDRDRATATIAMPREISEDWLIHPSLATVAAVFARWHGRNSLHAGAFVVDGAAWGVLGSYEAGKSTTLGWLARSGHPVIADDMVVAEAGRTFAGPRTVDLRAAAAPFVDDGSATEVRGGDRQRMKLDAGLDVECPLGGWFVLRWGTAISARPLTPRETLRAVLNHLHPVSADAGAAAALDLVRLPAYELTRPQRLELLPAVTEELIRTASGSASRANSR